MEILKKIHILFVVFCACNVLHAQKYIAYQVNISDNADTVCVNNDFKLKDSLLLKIDTLQDRFIVSLYEFTSETNLTNRISLKGNILSVYLSKNSLIITTRDKNNYKGSTSICFISFNDFKIKKYKAKIDRYLGNYRDTYYFLSNRLYKSEKGEKISFILEISSKTKRYIRNPMDKLHTNINKSELDFFNNEYYAISSKPNQSKTIVYRDDKAIFSDEEIAVYNSLIFNYKCGVVFYSYRNHAFYYIENDNINTLFKINEIIENFQLSTYLVDFAVIKDNIIAVINETRIQNNIADQTNRVIIFNLEEEKITFPKRTVNCQ